MRSFLLCFPDLESRQKKAYSDVRQWSFEHLEEEAKIEEAMLATSDEQVKKWLVYN